MPWNTRRTWASVVGVEKTGGLVGLGDAAQAAVTGVETLCVLARSLRYRATVRGSAGRHSRRCSAHHAEKIGPVEAVGP